MYTHWTTINWFTCLKQNGTSKGRQRWGTCLDQQRSRWGTESGTGCVDHTYQGWAHNGQWERQQSAAILARCPVCYKLCLCIAMFQILFDVPLFVETIQRGIGATADDNRPHTAVFSKVPPFPTNTWEIKGKVLLVDMLGVTSEGGVLITYWWEHLEQLQTRIEAIDEPHPMHIRSLCAGLTPLLTNAPMVSIIRWPVVVGHWLIRSVVWHGQHHQMLQLSDTNRDTQWWLVTAHPCWAFLSFTCCREMKSTFLFGVPQVTEVLQLT